MTDKPINPTSRRFEILFDEVPVSVQVLDPSGRTLRVNKAWELLWGLSDADGVKAWVLSGEYNVLTDPQLQREEVTSYLKRAFEGEAVDIPAVRYDPAKIGRAGRARMVGARACPVFNEDGTLAEVLLMHRDVTDRYQWELALQDRDQRLRLATDAAKIGIWDWDVQHDHVSWTPEVYALHGMVEGEFGGTAADFAGRVHPADREWLWPQIQRAIGEESGFTAEFRVMLPSGGDRWLSTSSCVYRGHEGDLRMVGATFSIDSYKRAMASLKDSDRRKDEFLAMLAHELRNPLAPIRSAAEALVIGAGGADQVRKLGAMVSRQAEHISRLLEDLLDVSRVTRGLVEIRREPVSLAEILHSAIEQARPLIESCGHTLETSMEAAALFVNGDRVRLIQAMVNILNNAARYTPRPGRIRVSLGGGAGLARVEVADNGQGISAELLPHVFELFTQGPRSLDRSIGGLGIGLALVKRVVEMHGGSIEACSEGPGSGATFVVRLPSIAGLVAETGVQPEKTSGSTRSLRIGVVDDNKDAAEALALLLQIEGHQAQTCHDGAEALALRGEFDLFLLDIGLPDINGIDLSRRLRATHPLASYVATSGYGQPSDVEQTRAAGFSHHLVKPIALEDLRTVLRQLDAESTPLDPSAMARNGAAGKVAASE